MLRKIRWARLGCVALALTCIALAWRVKALEERPTLTQRAYIADYELSSSGTGLIVAEVADPIVLTLEEPTLAEPTLAEPTLEEPTLEEPTLDEPTLEIYDALDLVSGVGDFPGSAPSGPLTPPQLEALIHVATQDLTSWDDDLTLEIHRGHIFVHQTPQVHDRIRELLRALRR